MWGVTFYAIIADISHITDYARHYGKYGGGGALVVTRVTALAWRASLWAVGTPTPRAAKFDGGVLDEVRRAPWAHPAHGRGSTYFQFRGGAREVCIKKPQPQRNPLRLFCTPLLTQYSVRRFPESGLVRAQTAGRRRQTFLAWHGVTSSAVVLAMPCSESLEGASGSFGAEPEASQAS